VHESADPFHCTVDPGTNPVPFTVKVNPTPPAGAELGLKALIVCAEGEALMVKVAALEVPPPGFTTVMLIVRLPADEIKLAGTEQLNCVAVTRVHDNADPFHCTVDPETNPVPVIVKVKAPPPVGTELGFRLVTVGAAGLIVKVAVFEDAPPGFTTVIVMVTLPVEEIKLAGTEQVNCVALT